MPRDKTAVRVGLMVLAAIATLATAVFVIGGKDFLFSRKIPYFVEFKTVGGLASGNPVQLDGVAVGRVDRVILPEDAGETLLRVWISVERRYAPRIRADSIARIQTLGLLGDKYVAIASGSPAFAQVEPSGAIQAAPATDVDKILASGGDVVDNLVATAGSLSRILARIERGDGLLGQLMVESQDGKNILRKVDRTVSSVEHIVESIDSGSGSLGRLIHSKDLAENLTRTVHRLDSILDTVEAGDGLLPQLLGDSGTRERFDTTLANLDETSRELASLAVELKTGGGLLPRLLNDENWADEVTEEIRQLLQQLGEITDKLNHGDGTAAALLNDPAVYEAMNDIMVGIDESKYLRWLIRRKQKKGIKKRYQEEVKEPVASDP